MSAMEFGPEDTAALVATFIGTTAVAGIVLWSLFNVTLPDMAFQLAGDDVTLATLLTLGAFSITVPTNDNARLSTPHQQAEDLDDCCYYSIVTSVGLLIGWVFFGDASLFVQSQGLWGVGYVAVSPTTQTTVGWML